MPISTKRFTEIRFMISDLLQRGSWHELFENCGTNDLDLAKSIANIFSMFEPTRIWRFVDYVTNLPQNARKQKRDSTLVAALVIGRVGKSDIKKSIRALRVLLSDDHMLRTPVEASLSNIWVFDPRTARKELFESWIINGEDNDDLQEIAVSSSEYLYQNDPQPVEEFLEKVLRTKESKQKPAVNAAKTLAAKYENGRRILKRYEKERINSSSPRSALSRSKVKNRVRKKKRITAKVRNAGKTKEAKKK